MYLILTYIHIVIFMEHGAYLFTFIVILSLSFFTMRRQYLLNFIRRIFFILHCFSSCSSSLAALSSFSSCFFLGSLSIHSFFSGNNNNDFRHIEKYSLFFLSVFPNRRNFMHEKKHIKI